MTELDMLRQVAAAADRLLRRADEDAARGRLNLAELWPAEITALSEAMHALDELDRAEQELDRIRARLAAWEAAQ